MTSRKHRGRPKGSVNREYVHVHAQPVRCPKCRSTNLVAVEGSKPIVRQIAGTTPDGDPYDTIKWQRSKCNDCGQAMTIVTKLRENNTSGII